MCADVVPARAGSVPRLLLTGREAAAALAVSERTLWTLSRCGELPAVRIGRSVRYSVDDLREYIASRTVRAAEPAEARR